MNWPTPHPDFLPSGLKPCRLCETNCMEVEVIDEGWDNAGRVIRIYAMCNTADAYHKDEIRTSGFDSEAEAVKEWNDYLSTEATENPND